ncbi:ATP-binding protein, partial [Rheinheimera sp.]|uniref:ATP-binding protein n=1 Tax=Rheinheimera sp. TaxID=1869214 RepID=UPI0037CB6B02
RLFTPFFRAHSSHNGIGLGLSIAKRVIEACGGSIIVNNIVHSGAIAGFKVVITFSISSWSVQ